MELGRLWTLRRKMGLLRYLKAQQSFCLDDSRRMGSMAPAEGLLSSRRETELSSKEEWGQAIARAVWRSRRRRSKRRARNGDCWGSEGLCSSRLLPHSSSSELSTLVFQGPCKYRHMRPISFLCNHCFVLVFLVKISVLWSGSTRFLHTTVCAAFSMWNDALKEMGYWVRETSIALGGV